MMNYYELINLLKDNASPEAIRAIRDDFQDNFASNAARVRLTESSRAAAAKKYAEKTTHFQTIQGFSLLSDGVSILSYNGAVTPNPEARVWNELSNSLFPQGTTARPIDFYYLETEALARSLGWKPGKFDAGHPWHILIDGNMYDFNLIYRVFSAVADSETYNRCELIGSGKFNMLRVITNHGAGLVLPMKYLENKSEYNVNFSAFMEYEKNLNEMLINAEKKGA